VEIGAHTVHHIALQGFSEKQAVAEIGQSRIQLEQKLGINITAFAYPYGSFDINALQVVKQAGFRTAVSTITGTEVDNSMRFLVHRIRPGAATGQLLIKELQSQ
jgi:peptidoglycan/xylan/chitin deacetylase (PgdA/CDA1 family)